MSDDKSGAESAMQKFEDLATRLFSVAKEDMEDVEEVAKEAVDDVLGPPPAGAPAVDFTRTGGRQKRHFQNSVNTWNTSILK
jgi:hypothetical protein